MLRKTRSMFWYFTSIWPGSEVKPLTNVLCILSLLFIFRVYCYKAVGSTRVLSERGSCKDMCGDTLKLLFKYGGKVYLRV